jgi:hypothetical protein
MRCERQPSAAARRIEQKARILNDRQVGTKAADSLDQFAPVKDCGRRHPSVGREGDLRIRRNKTVVDPALP